jgi:DNA (cytosine-5)-methyltransferase 1
MKHGSLFSGIGGFDLAAEWMGWENVFHCEWNEFGKRVLKYYWPEAESFHDIKKTDFKKYYGTIDVISGGFPCQPYSAAGKRLGKEDERHLWPEMLRAIREITPRYVVGENVRGLTNWNGGMVFDEVCSDLENLGYQIAPFIIPACATNAPHQRERIWFIAYAECIGGGKGSKNLSTQFARWERIVPNGSKRNASDTDRNGNGSKHEFRSGGDVPKKRANNSGSTTDSLRVGFTNSEETRNLRESQTTAQTKGGQFAVTFKTASCKSKSNWRDFPTQSPICGRNDGLSSELDGITFSKWRAESIKAYGNAVVPQVVYEIFKAIESIENLKQC